MVERPKLEAKAALKRPQSKRWRVNRMGFEFRASVPAL
jgi:hypothetical protein